MADRRIDQLTEAEDISDEDLFVIWKENISQTRSIKKGTMNLASKDYVDNIEKHPHPDWENAVNITAAQLYAGYTAPSDGMLICNLSFKSSSATLKINNKVIATAHHYSANDHEVPLYVQTPICNGDISKTNFTANSFGYSAMFVPWK